MAVMEGDVTVDGVMAVVSVMAGWRCSVILGVSFFRGGSE